MTACPTAWGTGINRNTQAFEVELVDDVEGPEALTRLQGIGHEVATPALVRLARGLQWLFAAREQPPLTASRQVQPQFAVHALERLAPAPGLVQVASTVVKQPEAVARFQCHVDLDEGDDPGVVACNGPIAQRGAGDAAGLAGTA